MTPCLTETEFNTLTKALLIAKAAVLIEVRDLEGVASPFAETHRELLNDITALSNVLSAHYPY